MAVAKRSSVRPLLLLGIAGCWLLGDFAYSRWVVHQIEQWEESVAWTSSQVQDSAQPYVLSGGRTALLLVHGFNDSPRAYRFVAPALAARGYTVSVLRLPGFGERVSEASTVTFSDWVDAIRAEAQSLRTHSDHVVVVGHSLGGAAVIALLRNTPEIADAAILLAPAIAVADDRSPLFSARTWHRIAGVALPFTEFFYSPFDRNDAVDPAVRNPADKPPYSSRLIVDEAFALLDANGSAAPQIKTPLLMVLGRRDAVVDGQAAQRFYEALGSSRKQLKVYEDSAHALPEDRDWQDLVQVMTGFILTVVE